MSAEPSGEPAPEHLPRSCADDYPRAMATYAARDVADDLRRRLPGVPTMKLHKLLYYAQGHHLATFGHPLFGDTISAWDMGPVVGQLWFAENQQGVSAAETPLAEAALNTVGYVVSRYGRLSGNELARLTHSEAPWLDADRQRRRSGSRTHRIELDALTAYFTHEVDDDESGEPPLDLDVVRTWLEQAGTQPRESPSWDTPESLLARLR